MRPARLAALVLLSACPALAQHSGKDVGAKDSGTRNAKDAAGAPPAAAVIGCTSLANLRALQRETRDDPAAALATIRRPGSDLGCAEIDPAQVTAVADHLVLGGQGYDCLSLHGTVVCHWARAGRLAPVAAPAPRPHPPERPKR